MLLSILIPTYNGKKLLQKSLPHLLKVIASTKNYEVILIDNASVDETEEFINRYENIKIIKLDKNFGFTAVNRGIEIAKGAYTLILNNDCFLEKNALMRMINFLEENPNFVATQPIVYLPDKSIEHIGYIVDLYKAKARAVKDIQEIKKYGENMKKNDRYFYGLSGTCLLIRTAVIRKLGMFDESFHSYLEDVDLCLRLVKNGFSYFPTLTAGCIHQHRGTSGKMGYYKEQHDLLNWLRIILKDYSPAFTLRHLPELTLERLRNVSGLIKRVIRL